MWIPDLVLRFVTVAELIMVKMETGPGFTSQKSLSPSVSREGKKVMGKKPFPFKLRRSKLDDMKDKKERFELNWRFSFVS